MLVLKMDDAQLHLLFKQLLAGGGNRIRLAGKIMVIRTLLDNQVAAFNRNQRSAADKKPSIMLADGRSQTLARALAGTHGFPNPMGKLLQGLKLASRVLSSPQGNAEDYCCKLTIGPPQARQFGDFCALFRYDHAARCGSIVWIGLESEFDQAVEEFG